MGQSKKETIGPTLNLISAASEEKEIKISKQEFRKWL